MSPQVQLALALFALVFPIWVFRARNVRLAGFEQRAWPAGRNVALAVLDAVRASFGAALAIRVAPDLPRVELLGRWQDPALLAVAVAAGLAVQCLAWRDEDFVFAPVAYVLGVATVAAHPIVLVIVLPLAIGSGLAVRAWAASLLGAGLGLGLVGLAVSQQDWRRAVLLGMAFCFPILLSMVAGRHLGWPRRQMSVG